MPRRGFVQYRMFDILCFFDPNLGVSLKAFREGFFRILCVFSGMFFDFVYVQKERCCRCVEFFEWNWVFFVNCFRLKLFGLLVGRLIKSFVSESIKILQSIFFVKINFFCIWNVSMSIKLLSIQYIQYREENLPLFAFTDDPVIFLIIAGFFN